MKKNIGKLEVSSINSLELCGVRDREGVLSTDFDSQGFTEWPGIIESGNSLFRLAEVDEGFPDSDGFRVSVATYEHLEEKAKS